MAYLSSVVASRFEHPLLASVLTFGIVFTGLGAFFKEADRLLQDPFPAALIDLWRPLIEPIANFHPIAAAFMGVFGILMVAISLAGYSLIGAAKILSMFRDQTAPTAS